MGSSSDVPLVLYRSAGPGLPRKEIGAFAAELRERLSESRGFTCLLTNDGELERLNRMFFGKAYPTDVLSFPSGEADPLGEMAISRQRAAAQAEEFGHSLFDEIRVLMLHGVLHLLGMDHETDRGAMARVEKKWRKELGLPVAGLIERARKR